MYVHTHTHKDYKNRKKLAILHNFLHRKIKCLIINVIVS